LRRVIGERRGSEVKGPRQSFVNDVEGIECVTWMARHSRVNASSTVRQRKVRPFESASETKSRHQRSFARLRFSRTGRGA
jgi:hypothetical protein